MAEGGYADADAPQERPEEVNSFFSIKNLKVAVVNIFCGTLNGYSIGFVGVYSTLYDISSTCSSFKSSEACETLSNAKCEWVSVDENSPYCAWKKQVACKQTYFDVDSCTQHDCVWNYGSSTCDNEHGYTAVESGIFAGAMILGCMIGSLFGGYVATLLGPKRSFLLVGIISVICSVLYHIATAVDFFWLLCAGRLVVGLVLGLVCVAAPMYVAFNADPKFSKMIGVMFQVFTTFGIFVAATVGLILGQTVSYSGSNQNLMGRMQGLCVFSTFLSLLVVLLGIFLGGNTAGNAHSAEEGNPSEEAHETSAGYSWGSMIGRLLVGAMVAGTLQLTGINAVMNYAPTIMDSLGMAPLVGNFVVMLWNFLTTIVSIPLASFISMRNMFLGGSLVTSVACLLLCGIPVYPGVADKSVKDGVAITGILIFIAAFEIGVGPCFYVLSQDLFPPSFRPKGASFTMVVQFIFNLIINVFYPTATKSISGGPSGNQNKGQAVAFIFFGSVGLVCFVTEIFFLFPWDDTKDGASEGDGASDAGEDMVKEDPSPPESTPSVEVGLQNINPRLVGDNRNDV